MKIYWTVLAGINAALAAHAALWGDMIGFAAAVLLLIFSLYKSKA